MSSTFVLIACLLATVEAHFGRVTRVLGPEDVEAVESSRVWNKSVIWTDALAPNLWAAPLEHLNLDSTLLDRLQNFQYLAPWIFLLAAGGLIAFGVKQIAQSSSESTDGNDANNPERMDLWTRIWLIYFACVLAPGVLPIWSVVQPKFSDAGVFAARCIDGVPGCQAQKGQLSLAYLLAFSVMLFFTWPLGLTFDHLGPRATSAIGAVLCCFAQASMAMSVEFPATMSGLLFIGAIFADFGGMMNRYALFGFLWHDPQRQGVLTGLANSSMATGTLMALVGVKLLPFRIALWLMTVTAGIAAYVCYRMAPSQEEYARNFAKMWNLDSLRQLASRFGYRAAWRLAWKFVKEKAQGQKTVPFGLTFFTSKLSMCYKIFNVNFADNLHFTISLVMLISFYCYFTAVQSPYLELLLFSENKSKLVCDFGASTYGVAGLFFAPMSGYISDRFGLKSMVLMVAGFNTVQIALIFIPMVPVLMVGSMAGACFAALYVTYASRWFALYAPPDQFGNYLGCVFSICGLASMIVCLTLYTFSQLFLSGVAFFVVPLAILGLGCVVSTNAFILYIYRRDLPDMPPNVEEDPPAEPLETPSKSLVATCWGKFCKGV